VQCCVDLAVAAAVEPMLCVIGRSDGYGCGAIPPRKHRPGPEPFDASNFSDDLRCREFAATGQSQQGRNHLPVESTNLVGEGISALI
jgi:hypothetical protein